MALEAVVFPQDLFGHTCKEWYTTGGGGGGGGGGGAWGCDLGAIIEQKLGNGGEGYAGGSWDSSCSSSVQNVEAWNVNNSASPEELSGSAAADEGGETHRVAVAAAAGRRKRRRTKCVKNKEEVETQRMTHIAVERNRRKQMNEYLTVLRSLMPPSYVQRGDQASIVGAAINYVKELEQLLQSLEVQKRLKQRADAATAEGSPFADFFTFPQYRSCSSNGGSSRVSSNNSNSVAINTDNFYSTHHKVTEKRTAMADIEVTMVESHANVKVLSKRRSRQLLKLILGLQGLRLTPLHLNVTTVDQMVLFSFSLKVEDDCSYTSVDEIAAAVHQMLGKIQEEEAIF